jgi:hypothetical protein
MFGDGSRTFAVRASSAYAPDSFQVYSAGHPADIVLVVGGLASGDLKATWSDQWRTASPEWKQWCKDQALNLFYNPRRPESGRVRTCNG